MSMAAMPDMPDMAMPFVAPWVFAMWWVMMLGMMLPSATPMILLFTAVQRKQGKQPVLTTWTFAAGYVLIWSTFAVVAATLQVKLGELALLSPSLTFVSIRFAGLAFLLAAAFEFTPLKNRCLTQCSSPIGFITTHWRPGIVGAFQMGVSHAAFCVGCCWALMLLLFAAGVMNLLWVAALAVLVLVQKILPYVRAITAVTGTTMALIGAALLVF